jgi:hypothetical protein
MIWFLLSIPSLQEYMDLEEKKNKEEIIKFIESE